MKYLIICLSLLFSLPVSARWMSEADINLINQRQPGATNYMRRGVCEARESTPCHDIRGHNLRRESVQEVEVDDLSKPLYGSKLNITADFETLELCQEALDNYCTDVESGYDLRALCAKEDGLETYEAYCIASAPQSYVQKTVRQLVEDPTLVALTETEDTESQNKRDQVTNARQQLRNAIQNWGDLTNAQQKQVLRYLIRLLLQE